MPEPSEPVLIQPPNPPTEIDRLRQTWDFISHAAIKDSLSIMTDGNKDEIINTITRISNLGIILELALREMKAQG